MALEVYKFGGASVSTAEGVRNLAGILAGAGKPLVLVVSAMGKTTNSLEELLESYIRNDREKAETVFSELYGFHGRMMEELQLSDRSRVEQLFDRMRALLARPVDRAFSYDETYDGLVCYGELLSTAILAAYLGERGLRVKWVDMRCCMVTDDRFREANIDFAASATALRAITDDSQAEVFLMQGFIGATPGGRPTTLGREGSDYTAAAVANMLECSKVTIWKDVPGILNADPRLFPDSVLIPELSYLDAVELAYSGAHIIHPKTIKPLQNKRIPLFVRPFGNPSAPGSVIREEAAYSSVPVLIVRPKQILVSLRPHDFSFVLEESLETLFRQVNIFRQKVNLVQNSAVSINISIDESRNFNAFRQALSETFGVRYNTGLELLTVRRSNDEIVERERQRSRIYLEQKTRHSYRLLRAVSS